MPDDSMPDDSMPDAPMPDDPVPDDPVPDDPMPDDAVPDDPVSDEPDLALVRRLARPLAVVSSRPDVVAEVIRRAVADHDEPHRHYHTPEHLREMVAEVERLTGTLEPALAGAIAFHDVVYEPDRGDNEVAAAGRARTDLGGEVDDDVVATVERLVLVTAGHEVVAGDPLGAVIVDADLWILASPWQRYDRYVHDVRAEYAHLDDAAWREGRRAVLDRLRQQMATVGFRFGDEDDRAARTRRALANIDREWTVLVG